MPATSRISRIHTADVRAARGLVANRIIFFKEEGVIARRVFTQRGIVVHRTERKRSAAAPTAHHLRGDDLFVHRIGGVRFQILAKFGDSLVQLAKDDIGSIAAQDVRLRNRRAFAHFVGVTQYEFSGLERMFMRISARNSRALDCGMTDAVFESERFSFAGKNVTILSPDRCDALELRVGFAGSFECRRQLLAAGRKGGHDDVNIGRSKRLLPMLRTAFAIVPERLGTCGHSLLELRRETIERGLRHTQRFQTLIGQCDADPGIAAGGVCCRSDNGAEPTHQGSSAIAIIDTKKHIGCSIGSRARTQHSTLNIVEFESDGHVFLLCAQKLMAPNICVE